MISSGKRSKADDVDGATAGSSSFIMVGFFSIDDLRISSAAMVAIASCTVHSLDFELRARCSNARCSMNRRTTDDERGDHNDCRLLLMKMVIVVGDRSTLEP